MKEKRKEVASPINFSPLKSILYFHFAEVSEMKYFLYTDEINYNE